MSGSLLWLTQNYHPQQGGMAQSCDRIVSGLRKRGWRIDLVHFSSRWTELVSQKKLAGMDIRCPLEADINHTLNCLWCALPYLGSGEYDGIVAFGGYVPMLAAPVFAAWLQKPLFTLIRGNDFDTAVFDVKRVGMLERALKASSRVVVVSQDKQARIAGLWPEVAVEWIANGIDHESWQPLSSDRDQAAALRDQWQENRNVTVLGMFGHIKRKKGGGYFIDALLRSGRASEVHLLVVGDMEPDLSDKLNQQSPQLSYTHIPFADRYSLIPYYLACDYVCIPSYYDGMPNVMLEAAALGIPMLASRAGGMADMLEDGRHGYLFAPGHTDDCARAISTACSTETQQHQILSEACQSLVTEHLNQTIELNRYEQLFVAELGQSKLSNHLRVIRE
ncbi:glycosyltransferase family 4 protein [Gynuella sp.]|uniref:glycosyltransferase family 4 protein n=1 Tax=Gynuella sp. TaxID=2969146 RepID=UPI003D0E4E70